MDGVLTAVLGAGPQLGGVGAFVALVVLLIRREVQTTERHGIELDRLSRTHDAETAELRTELDKVRAQRDAAEQALREHWREHEPPAPGPSGGGRSPWAG